MPLESLIDPFRPEFMQRALVAVVLLAVPAGLLGAWVVTRRLAFAAHAVGHATFPALVVAIIAGWSLTATSLVTSVVVAVALGWLAAHRSFGGGTGVAIVLAASLALGAILVSDVADPGVRANALLFGSLLAVSWVNVAQAAVVAVLAVAVTLFAGRHLASATFQREMAIADGQRASVLDAILMACLGAAIAVAVTAVGSLLVAALFLVPAATARLLTRRLVPMYFIGMCLAAGEGVIGLWLAYRLNALPGATIALTSAVVYTLVATLHVRLPTRRREVGMIPS